MTLFIIHMKLGCRVNMVIYTTKGQLYLMLSPVLLKTTLKLFVLNQITNTEKLELCLSRLHIREHTQLLFGHMNWGYNVCVQSPECHV